MNQEAYIIYYRLKMAPWKIDGAKRKPAVQERECLIGVGTSELEHLG